MKRTIRLAVRRHVPTPAIRALQGVMNVSRAERHECSLCGYEGRFWPFGSPPRRGAACGKCDSRERHRLVALWIAENPGVLGGKRVLHFAPEPFLESLLKNQSGEYRSADLNPGAAEAVLNIEAIDLPSESVDVVMCSHVLEHVDDEKALQEIFRVLTPGGHALLMFPIVEGWQHTYEDPRHRTPSERITYFGQADHVRMYGRDVRDRITGAGFALEEFTAEAAAVARFGLLRGEKLFIAIKPTG